MLTMFSKHLSSLKTSLRCFHEILSGPGANKLLHMLIAIINYFPEKRFYDEYCLNGSSSNKDLCYDLKSLGLDKKTTLILEKYKRT